MATGTGFIVESARGPHLLTCRHNFTGRNQHTGVLLSGSAALPDEVQIAHNNLNGVGSWILVEESLQLNGVPRWKEHPVLGAKADFVALPLQRLANVQIYPFDPAKPGDAIAVGPSDTISVIGFPFGRSAGGYLGIWATGFVASEPDFNQDGLPTIYIDCRTRPGQSGSPVVAFRSGGAIRTLDGNVALSADGLVRFMGLYSGRINQDSDIGIVWKASAIAELVAVL